MTITSADIQSLLSFNAQTVSLALSRKARRPSSIIVSHDNPMASKVVSDARKLGIKVMACADIFSIPITDAMRQATFVVANGSSKEERAALAFMGLKTITVPLLYWTLPKNFLPWGGIDIPQRLIDCKEEIVQAFDTFHDDASKQEYHDQLKWRLSLEDGILGPHLPHDDIYFLDNIVTIKQEVLVDGGAWDGDTIRDFITRDRLEYCYAIEPDPSTVAKLTAFITSSGLSSRIEVHPVALWSSCGAIPFNAMGTMGSQVDFANGAIAVECATIDSIVKRPITYIKLDVKSSEVNVIKGAAQTISRDHPVLAISAYHSPQDLWRLPNLIKEIYPDYNVFLRRHDEDCWEIMIYAVPAERMLK
jgi:FkbM family methyltransferase